MANPKPLHRRFATVTSGENFKCYVEIDADEPGPSIVLFKGSREIAERIAFSWNAQFGVPTNDIRALGEDEG